MSREISYHKVVIVRRKPEQILHHESLDAQQTPGYEHHLQYYYMQTTATTTKGWDRMMAVKINKVSEHCNNV